MAGRIKRRRPRVVWLPLSNENRIGVGTASTGDSPSLFGEFATSALGFPGAIGGSTTAVFPVVQDEGVNVALEGVNSLADITQSSYRLRRIVGKLFVGVQQLNDQDAAISGVVTAGFIVLRVRPNTGIPLGAPFEYNTAILNNISDPWIWRRAWHLGNNAANLLVPAQGRPFWPEANSGYGSVLDGPHIDAKTARVIGPEERLFLVLTATTTFSVTQLETLTSVFVVGDFRVLASMRSSQGNRGNSNR